MYPEGRYVVLSEFQRRFLGDIPVEAVVYNGIETGAFPWSAEKGKYLAFLGDLREDTGPLAAVALSQESGIPLRLAGRETPWSRGVLARLIDGRLIEYVGELDHDGKAELLAGALALVFLSPGLEACPLVLLESMACGTPVLALNRGPVPELVTEGVTGFYADDLPELVPAGGVGGWRGRGGGARPRPARAARAPPPRRARAAAGAGGWQGGRAGAPRAAAPPPPAPPNDKSRSLQ